MLEIILSATGRLPYFDAVRGVMILFVIQIHAATTGRHFLADGLFDPNFIYTVLVEQVMVCAVPVFFFVSGYFSQAGAPAPGQLVRRLIRLLIPFLFWSLVALALVDALQPWTSAAQSILSGRARGPYYFVLPLLFFTIVGPSVLRQISHRPWFVPASLAATLVHIGLSYMVHVMRPDLDYWWFMVWPTAWIGYYGLGLAFCRGIVPLQSKTTIALLILGGLLASWAEAFAWSAWLGPNAGAFEPNKVSSFLYAIGVCCLVMRWAASARAPRWLAWVGSASYGIFLVHDFFVAQLAGVFARLAVVEVQPLYQAVLLTGAAAATIGVAVCVQTLLRSRARLLGF